MITLYKKPTTNHIIQTNALIAAALDNDDMMSSEDEGVRPDRGSADEDEESVDEDFQADSESDVAEEYDSAHESSGSGSDAEMDDASDGGDDGGDVDMSEDENRPKKKTKVAK
jgi:structure-specific recognition protein 1